MARIEHAHVCTLPTHGNAHPYHIYSHTHTCSTQILMDDRPMEQIPSHPPPPPYETDISSADENASLLAPRSIQEETTDGARGVTLQLQAPPKGAK